MSTEPTTNEPAEPAKIAPILPIPNAEAKLRTIAEAQGVVLDGKAYERLLGAGKGLWDSEEDFERFMQILREQRAKG
ncbi:MAG: hypothetical protein L0241_12760 [Planctomycetia bacterium]|nr:hypothetical protein [Planctomycetia bacterium]